MTEFQQLKESVEGALRAGRPAEVVARLAPFVDSGGRAPTRDDELWLHRTLGLALSVTEAIEDALEQLGQAYHLEPRDLEVAATYGDLLIESERVDEGINVLRALLIHHKADLPPDRLADAYCRLGEYHLSQGELRKARNELDDALRADPANPRALDGMLRTIEALPDDEAKRTRRILLKRLDEPGAKVRVMLGEAQRLAAAPSPDLHEAERLSDKALQLASGNVDLLRFRAELLERLGRQVDAAHALRYLARALPNGAREEKLEHLARARDLLPQSEAAAPARVKVLEAVLDVEPTRLELFEEITSLCAATGDWRRLAGAYERMIHRCQTLDSGCDPRVLSLLWRNLGELWATHLNKPDAAIEALQVAARLAPGDSVARARLFDLCRGREDRHELAHQTARELVALRPDSTEAFHGLVQTGLQTGRYDEALCVLRVLHAEGRWSEALDPFYERLNRTGFKLSGQILSADLRRKHLRPSGQSKALNNVMAIGHILFNRLFAHDLSFHGLSEKDRLDLSESLLFNRIYTVVAQCLGVDPLPRVYVKPNMTGLASAVLERPALVAGPDMMSGRSEAEIAFTVAQQLVLQRPEYVLTTIHKPVHLATILLVLTNHVDGSVPVKGSSTVTALRKALDKRLTPDLSAHLKETVTRIISQKLDVNVEAWVDSVADQSVRAGLLVCDDLEVADRLIPDAAGPRGAGPAEERIGRLHRWAVSRDYLRLREALGIQVAG